ncbi:MAG: hypothetical protein PF588_08600 [Candidatus Kapabacteria bacterium]|jgi:hypothetical protein|nr:hypothetical protein [Candidatus Kapabacteria bacterium]
MKTILIILFIAFTSMTYAQELPTPPAPGFAFPIGTKFTIKLHAIDSLNFNFSIIAFEPFTKTVDTYNNSDLFDKKGQDSTITFYFCLGTSGENEKEKKKNMKVLLLMKNYSKFALQYKSDIQLKEEGKFENTSNVGLFPGAKATEMWPYMINMIGLNNFQKNKLFSK